MRPSTRHIAILGVLFAGVCTAAIATGLMVQNQGKVQALTACERETARFYSGLDGDEFTIACMDVRGYQFDVTPTDCDSRSRIARQPACYTALGLFGWIRWSLSRPRQTRNSFKEFLELKAAATALDLR